MLLLIPYLINCAYVIDQGVLTISNVSIISKNDIDMLSAVFTEVIIEDTVQEIGELAFSEQSVLTKVQVSNSVINIDETSFDECYNLKSINIDEQNEYYSNYQNDGILYDKNITRLILCPSGISGEVHIPETVSIIDDYAFENCKLIINISMSNTVRIIKNFAFMNCVHISNIVLPETLQTIQASAFHNCSSLTSINIPKLVESIDETSFDECYNLKSINIDEQNEYYSNYQNDGILYDKNITRLILCPSGISGEVHIPETVSIIDDYAFEDCNLISNITLSISIQTIGKFAFVNCNSLTSILITKSVESIDETSFDECYNLKSINVDEQNEYYSNYQNDGILYNKNKTRLILCPYNAPEFINIPDSVVIINEYAFEDCGNIKSVTLSQSLIYIGVFAFYNCSSLTSINIPKLVESIDETSFDECYNLKSINIDEQNEYYSNYQNDGILYDKNITRLILCPSGISGEVHIPETVSIIDDYAFENCKLIVNVEIPKSVSSIGKYSFSYCDSLERILIKGTIESIGEYAFVECPNLSTLYYCGESEPDYNISIFNASFYPNVYVSNKYKEIIFANVTTSIPDDISKFCTSDAQRNSRFPIFAVIMAMILIGTII